jgi:hypothetical protein
MIHWVPSKRATDARAQPDSSRRRAQHLSAGHRIKFLTRTADVSTGCIGRRSARTSSPIGRLPAAVTKDYPIAKSPIRRGRSDEHRAPAAARLQACATAAQGLSGGRP